MIHEPMHTCQFGGTASCIACYNETNAKKEYQKNLEHEPMHSCGDVTDEPCDACINEKEELSQKSKLILSRLKRIEKQTQELYEENKELHDRMLNNDIELSVLSEEKSQIIMKLL